jgi:hypothetical protein
MGCATLGKSLDFTELLSLIYQMEIIIGTHGDAGKG